MSYDVAVIGLGRVGLPLAITFADHLYAEDHLAQGLAVAALHDREVREVDEQGGQAPEGEEHARGDVRELPRAPAVDQGARRGEQARHDAEQQHVDYCRQHPPAYDLRVRSHRSPVGYSCHDLPLSSAFRADTKMMRRRSRSVIGRGDDPGYGRGRIFSPPLLTPGAARGRHPASPRGSCRGRTNPPGAPPVGPRTDVLPPTRD